LPNPVAVSQTCWTQDEAAGASSLEDVFKIINQNARQTVEIPTVLALQDSAIVGLVNHTLRCSE